MSNALASLGFEDSLFSVIIVLMVAEGRATHRQSERNET